MTTPGQITRAWEFIDCAGRRRPADRTGTKHTEAVCVNSFARWLPKTAPIRRTGAIGLARPASACMCFGSAAPLAWLAIKILQRPARRGASLQRAGAIERGGQAAGHARRRRKAIKTSYIFQFSREANQSLNRSSRLLSLTNRLRGLAACQIGAGHESACTQSLAGGCRNVTRAVWVDG
jgi:hypothetical protein